MAGEGATMNKQMGMPPRWAEFALERILADRDRQTVTGDLREAYAEEIFPRIGRLRADLWYLRQVLSFAPMGVSEQCRMRRVLLSGSVFTFACGCWLSLMEWLLRHPGYLLRSGVDVSIALVSLATIAVLSLRLGIRAERWLRLGAIFLLGIAIQGLVRDVRSTHFEGFALLIALALALEGVLMLLSLGRAGSRPLAHETGRSQ